MRRRLHTNTPLARKLATEYERMTGKAFPGGITNACIRRTYAGWSMRDAGAWSWKLVCIERVYHPTRQYEEVWPTPFGSQWPAKSALKNPDEFIDVGEYDRRRMTH